MGGFADISTVDWSKLHHAYGSAVDVPDRWRDFLARRGDPGDFINTVCHQGTCYSATPALLPFAIALAKADHPAAGPALELLGCVLRGHGELAKRATLASLSGVINPATGQPMSFGPGPSEERLEEELQGVLAMHERIESDFPTWRARLRDSDREVRLGAAYLLAGVRSSHPDADEVPELLHDAIEAAASDLERERLGDILEELEGYEDDWDDDDWDDEEE